MTDEMPTIRVWRFHQAPACYQVLSPHGGDEDWLAHVPKELADEWIPWLEHGGFGGCEISKHVLSDGAVVKIGAHS